MGMATNETEARARIQKNFSAALNPSQHIANLDIISPRSEVMDNLETLHTRYLQLLQQELDEGVGLTQDRVRLLGMAMQQPTMNFNLISSYQSRKELQNQFEKMIMLTGSTGQSGSGGTFGVLGFPSVPIPSGNPRKMSALMMTPGSSHPLDILLSGRTFNMSLDTKKIEIGYSSIPTPDYMRELMQQRTSPPLKEITEKLARGERVKYFSLDIETTGVGTDDIARSLSGQMYDSHLPGTSVATSIAGMSADPSGRVGFHLIAPEMQNLVVSRSTGQGTRLGTEIARKEARSLLTENIDDIFDLSDPLQRRQAADSYFKLFNFMAQDDVYIVGNNVGAFDIPKVVQSIAQLQEFSDIDGADELVSKVISKLNNGKIIDMTQISGQYLQGKLIERLRQSGIDLQDTERAIDFVRTNLLAPETIAKGGLLGEGVKPRSMENLLLSTNMLELIKDSADQGNTEASKVIDALQRGTHISEIDQYFSGELLRRINDQSLDLLGAGHVQDPILRGIRQTIARSVAPFSTANIVDVNQMSDNLLRFMISPSGKGTLQGVRVSSQGGDAMIAFNAETGMYEESFLRGSKAGQVSPIRTQLAEMKIRTVLHQELTALQPGGSAPVDRMLTSGISYAEASQMRRMLDYVSTTSTISPVVTANATSVTSRVPFVNVSALDATQQKEFLGSLLTTRQTIGFPYLAERPEIISRGDLALTRSMADRYDPIPENLVTQAFRSLHSGGAGLGFLDPSMRGSFVAASTLTSEIPFTVPRDSLARPVVDAVDEVSQTTTLPTQILRRAGLISPGDILPTDVERVKSMALRGQKIARQASELGVVFTRAQETTRILTTDSEVVSKPMMSAKLTEEIKRIKGDTFFSDIGLDKAHFSIVDGKDRVNLVLGSGQMQRSKAQELAESIVEVWRQNAGKTTEEMVKSGLAGDELEAIAIKNILKSSSSGTIADAAQISADELVDKLTDTFVRSGPVSGFIEGAPAQGVTALLRRLGGSITNDVEPVRRGFLFQVNEMGEQYNAVTASISTAAEQVLEAENPALHAAARSQMVGGQYETFLSIVREAEENPEFRRNLETNFSRARVDTGIRGTSIFRNRTLRDESIVNFITKHKPKMAVAALGVAAFSAGYYIARRNRKNEMFNEVMNQQPYEDTGLVQEANDDIQADKQIYSARRDPLVTAGVVGNLDRNKIGHTKMGPNKYDYLYGR